MPTILHRWRRAGYTPADVRGWQVADALMSSSVGPQTRSMLKRYGLEDLTQWLGDAIIKKKSQDQILLELHDQPAFRKRFPAIRAREQAGLPPVSPEEYLAYEELASSLGSTWGLDLSKKEVDALLTNDVSPAELEQRFNIAATAVFESDRETRDELQRLFGVGQGDLMRYWMNPKEQFGVLQNQYRMGEIAGAALRTNYGQIDLAAAERLLEAGFDRNAALSGFGELQRQRSLMSPIGLGERGFTQEEQVEMLAGDVELQRSLERQAQGRVAEFAGGGGFAPGEEGFATGAVTQR